MKKILNIILNQLGVVVLIIAGLLLYYDYFELTWNFVIVVGIVLIAILVTSKSLHTILKS